MVKGSSTKTADFPTEIVEPEETMGWYTQSGWKHIILKFYALWKYPSKNNDKMTFPKHRKSGAFIAHRLREKQILTLQTERMVTDVEEAQKKVEQQKELIYRLK